MGALANEYRDSETTQRIITEEMGTNWCSVLIHQSWHKLPGACLYLHPPCAVRQLQSWVIFS